MDCLKGMKQIDDNSTDLIITSPPYFVGKEYEMECIKFDDYINGLMKTFLECYRILKPSGYLCINIDDAHVGSKHPEYNGKSAGNLGTHAHLITKLSKKFTYKDSIIWNKIRNFSGMLFINHPHYPISAFGEFILIFKKEGKTERSKDERKSNQLTKIEYIEFTKGIWNFKGKTKGRFHPSEFPEELPYRLIKMFSFKGDIIIDPYVGSGTTGLVAKQLERNFIGFEINPTYVKIAEKRLSQETLHSLDTKHEGDGGTNFTQNSL